MSEHFERKKSGKKNWQNLTKEFDKKLTKGFAWYQVFMYNFLCQTVLIFPILILFTKRIDIFWSGGIDTFWSGGIISTFWDQKIRLERLIKYIKIFELIKSSCTKMTWYSHIAYYRHTLKAFQKLLTLLSKHWIYVFFSSFNMHHALTLRLSLFKCLFIIQCFF